MARGGDVMADDYGSSALTLDLGMADQLAGYRWGSLFCHFHLAPATARSLAEILSSIANGGWAFKGDEPVARAVLSFLHELTHLLQDVTTGVGHWDYLVRRKYTPELLSQIRMLSWDVQQQPPYDLAAFEDTPLESSSAAVRRLLHDMLDELVCVPSAKFPAARRELIESHLAARFGSRTEDATEEIRAAVAMLEPETLLENEAMTTVTYIVLSMGATDEDWAILSDLSPLWSGTEMPARYRELFQNFSTVLGDAPDDQALASRFLGQAILIFNLLADLAMAHPSPRWLARTGESRAEYEPGIRFRRLMLALQTMDAAQTQMFLDYVNSDSPSGAEEVLLSACDYSYPHSREVYRDWDEVLSAIVDDPVAANRARVSSQRADHGVLLLKTADQALQFEVPLHIYSSMGYQRIRYRGPGALAEVAGIYSDTVTTEWDLDELEAEITVLALDDALLPYLVETGVFRCPLATRGLCSARTPECRAGFRSLTSLPPSPGCHARSRLYEMSFNTVWTKSGRIADDHGEGTIKPDGGGGL